MVLTAAHCISLPLHPYVVVARAHNNSVASAEASIQTRQALTLLPHPEFMFSFLGTPDVGLMLLEAAFELNGKGYVFVVVVVVVVVFTGKG